MNGWKLMKLDLSGAGGYGLGVARSVSAGKADEATAPALMHVARFLEGGSDRGKSVSLSFFNHIRQIVAIHTVNLLCSPFAFCSGVNCATA